MKDWKVIAMVVLFLIATIAGFKGCFRQKYRPSLQSWENPETTADIMAWSNYVYGSFEERKEAQAKQYLALSNYAYETVQAFKAGPITNYVIASNRTVFVNAGYFTNVVISDDFAGSVWMGDSFFKMSIKTNAP